MEIEFSKRLPLDADFKKHLATVYVEVLKRLPRPGINTGSVAFQALACTNVSPSSKWYGDLMGFAARLIRRLPKTFSGTFKASCVNMLREVFSDEEIADLLLTHCPQSLTCGERRVAIKFLVDRVHLTEEQAIDKFKDWPTRFRSGRYDKKPERCEFVS